MPEGSADAVGASEHGGLGIEELGPGKDEKIERPQRKDDIDPKVIEVYKLLKRLIAQPERKKWIEKRHECWDAAYEAKIWTDDEIKQMEDKGMIPLAINDVYQGLRGSAAVITDNRPGIEFLPIGSGDLYVAELMKRAHDQVWNQNDGGSELYDMVKEAKLGGIAATDHKHDPSKGIYGKQVFGNIDPETLYFDMKRSRKPDLSDVDIIKAHKITKSKAKELYEELSDEDFLFSGPEKSDVVDKLDDYKTGEDNYISKKDQTPPNPEDEFSEKEEVWEIEAHLLKREREYWLMTPKEGGGFERKIFKKEQKAEAEAASKNIQNAVLWPRMVEKRSMRIIVGKKMISETFNPHGIDAEGDPVLPIVILCHEKTRKGRPVSPTVFAKEACRERNKRRAQAIYVVSKNIDAPIVTGGEFRWHRDKVHGDVLQVDKASPFPPQRMAPGSVSTEAMNLEQVAKADVNDFYDMQDVMRGKLPTGDPSGRTVLALQDTAGTMTRPFVRTTESCLVRIGKVNMALILNNWPREKWERLIEADEMETWEPEEGKEQPGAMEMLNGEQPEPNPDDIKSKWMAALELIRPSDPTQPPVISLIDVDVRVAAGSTMPTNRMARSSMAMEMTKAGIYDAQAALDYIDDPKKDAIAKRMQKKEQAMLAAGMAKGAGA